MPKPLAAIGERLKEERKRLMLEVGELADKAGIHRNSVNNYEAGTSPINAAMLLIYEDLGMDITYIVSGQRSNGELGFAEKQLLEAFSRLSQRERDGVMYLTLTLAGQTVSADELSMSLHEKRAGFEQEKKL